MDGGPEAARVARLLAVLRQRDYNIAMPNSNADDLADRFLDIWQEHIARLSTDPQMAEAMSRLFSAMALPGAFGLDGAGPGNTRPGAFGAQGLGAGGAAASWAEWMHGWMTGGTGDGTNDGFPPKGPGTGAKDDGTGSPPGPDPRRAAAADAASLDGRELLVRIHDRLAALEERVAALEGDGPRRDDAGDDRTGRGTRSGSGRRGGG